MVEFMNSTEYCDDFAITVKTEHMKINNGPCFLDNFVSTLYFLAVYFVDHPNATVWTQGKCAFLPHSTGVYAVFTCGKLS